MASHVADTREPVSEESLRVISDQELEEARNDPEVIARLRDADRVLAKRKAARERHHEGR